MKLVVGIGNPGPGYRDTRHNCGFMVVDRWAGDHGLSFTAQRRPPVHHTTWSQAGVQALLIKPQTYVNLSGRAVQAVMTARRIRPEEVLVVVDDLNLPLGTLRLRPDGSHGGHNGLRSIEEAIGRSYQRLRLGIGRPPTAGDAQVGHVLGPFLAEEQTLASAMIVRAAACLNIWLQHGHVEAMRANGPTPTPTGS